MGFRELADVHRAVSVFGSARSAPGSPGYELAREVGRRLGAAGFAVITGGGPGAMEAANRGAREAGALSIGLNIDLPFESRPRQAVARPLAGLPLLLHPQGHVRALRQRLRRRCPAATARSTSSSRRCASSRPRRSATSRSSSWGRTYWCGLDRLAARHRGRRGHDLARRPRPAARHRRPRPRRRDRAARRRPSRASEHSPEGACTRMVGGLPSRIDSPSPRPMSPGHRASIPMTPGGRQIRTDAAGVPGDARPAVAAPAHLVAATGAPAGSLNQVLDKTLSDVVDPRRQRWVAAQRSAGVTEPDDPRGPGVDAEVQLPAGRRHRRGRRVAVRHRRAAAAERQGGRAPRFMVIVSDVIYPAGDVNEYVDAFYLPVRATTTQADLRAARQPRLATTGSTASCTTSATPSRCRRVAYASTGLGAGEPASPASSGGGAATASATLLAELQVARRRRAAGRPQPGPYWAIDAGHDPARRDRHRRRRNASTASRPSGCAASRAGPSARRSCSPASRSDRQPPVRPGHDQHERNPDDPRAANRATTVDDIFRDAEPSLHRHDRRRHPQLPALPRQDSPTRPRVAVHRLRRRRRVLRARPTRWAGSTSLRRAWSRSRPRRRVR